MIHLWMKHGFFEWKNDRTRNIFFFLFYFLIEILKRNFQNSSFIRMAISTIASEPNWALLVFRKQFKISASCGSFHTRAVLTEWHLAVTASVHGQETETENTTWLLVLIHLCPLGYLCLGSGRECHYCYEDVEDFFTIGELEIGKVCLRLKCRLTGN